MNAQRLKRGISRNSSTILTVVGAVGVIATGVSAARATPKALKYIKEAEEQKGEELTTRETILATSKAYLPTIAIGASTIACIFSANILTKNQQKAMAGAYALVNETFKDYRKTLINLHGEEADIEVRDTMILSREFDDFHKLHVDIPDQKCIFYEECTGQTLVAYEREIMDAEYHINRNFVFRGYMTLEEYLSIFGLETFPGADDIGWSITDGYYWIDFSHRKLIKDGEKVCVISPQIPPDEDSLEAWTW